MTFDSLGHRFDSDTGRVPQKGNLVLRPTVFLLEQCCLEAGLVLLDLHHDVVNIVEHVASARRQQILEPVVVLDEVGKRQLQQG